MDAAELLSVALAAQNESAPIYTQGLPAWLDGTYLNRATSVRVHEVLLLAGTEVSICAADPRRWLIQFFGRDAAAGPTQFRPSFLPAPYAFATLTGRFFGQFPIFSSGLAVPSSWFAVCTTNQFVQVVENYAA